MAPLVSRLDKLAKPFLRAGRGHFVAAVLDTALGGRVGGHQTLRCTCGGNHSRNMRASTLERPVYFVYRAGSRAWGSVRMRVFQLAAALRTVANNPRQVHVVTEEQLRRHPPMDSEVILSKYVLCEPNRSWFGELRGTGNILTADVVDGSPLPGIENVVDRFLCASESEFLFRNRSQVPAVRLLHAVDSRFRVRHFERNRFLIGYFGPAGGAEHGSSLRDLKSRESRLSMSHWEALRASREVKRWSHHYSVRVFFGEGVFKPATKAYVAARFGGVFIGSKDDLESLLVFGDSYPYLAESSNLFDVEAVLSYAANTFETPVWDGAVRKMEGLREETCDLFLGAKLAEALKL